MIASARPLVVAWAAATVLLALLLTANAHAEAVPCPLPPTDYAGTEDVIAELRELRQEQAGSCAAIHDRLEALRARLVETRDHVAPLDGRLETIANNTTPTAGPPAPNVVEIEGVDPATLGADAEAVVNDFNATLWWLGGLLVALFAGYQVLRQVLPR